MEFKFESVSKSFGITEVLDNISGTVKDGVTGILGTNGSGKTTFVKILAGLLKAEKGIFNLNGSDVDLESQAWRNKIGYLPQSPGLYNRMTVYEFLDYMLLLSRWGNRRERKDRINEIVGELNLVQYLDNPIGHLSGGTKQRAAIAQAIIHNPEIIFLDEPTNNLDAEERERFNNYLLKISEAKIILYIGHIVNELVSICSNVLLIGDKQIRFYDAPCKMIEASMPFVKEIVVTKDEFENNFAGSKAVLSSALKDDSIVVHYDCRIVEIPSGMPVTPTLEESYKAFNNSNCLKS